jgi:hypothetical protein
MHQKLAHEVPMQWQGKVPPLHALKESHAAKAVGEDAEILLARTVL